MAKANKVLRSYRIKPSVLENMKDMVKDMKAEKVKVNDTVLIEKAIMELYRQYEKDKQSLKRILTA